MSSPRLFSEKLNNLEKSYDKINQLEATTKQSFDELDKRLSDVETKINQIIEEITPILSSHADALKKLLSSIQNNSKQ